MNSVAFIDAEIEPNSRRILDIGGVKDNGSIFHSNSITDFTNFIRGTDFICGHNIFDHDLKFLQRSITNAGIDHSNFIDTLYLSPLLFPARPYHALPKDDKLQAEELNDPLNDSIKARALFHAEVAAFHDLNEPIKEIMYLLLKDKTEFRSFFHFIKFERSRTDLEHLIKKNFLSEICEHVSLKEIISEYPIELAYCLALINCSDRYSITPPWVLKNFPAVEQIMISLRNDPCQMSCAYCNDTLSIQKGLKSFFGFDHFRTYAGEPLQEKAVKAAVNNRSLLAVFPTGGGKSITFQLPALMNGISVKGLTVVISPLQSLMKDQVDNLEKKQITDAVTINGLLDPIERSKAFERVADGSASILYISPESLRSKTIEGLLLGRNIVRFVIDEAHCFSAWGQDFRVDYLYIGDLIKQLQEKKGSKVPIPVSCFTATAKKKVIEDICIYFREKLSIDLEIFSSTATRSNLRYKVFQKDNEEEKYNVTRDLIEEKKCPTIIYVSRTRKAYSLSERLTKDGFNAKPYHGKMDVSEKTANQDAFIKGDVQIIVATSAFGMGVDKSDVGLVLHYEISNSLENYIQEAGRAGRDDKMNADCFVLFSEEDLGSHFILLNQTKLSIKEIQQVWKAIKDITKFRSSVSNSALEIARKAGWDDNIVEIETRVTTAIAALEDAGYLRRGQNMPRVFANSILSRTAQEAIDKINASAVILEEQKQNAVRIIKKLISTKNKKQASDEIAESRIDHIADHLGIRKEEVINIVNLLREENILADAKDLTAFIKRSENTNRSLKIVDAFGLIENFLFSLFEENEKIFHIKQINESAEEIGCNDVSPNKIRTLINFWAIKKWIKREHQQFSRDHFTIACAQPKELLKEKLVKRHELAKFIVEFLYRKTSSKIGDIDNAKEEILIEFSVHELKFEFEKIPKLFEIKISIDDIEDTLFYLSRIDAIKIEGGFLVLYNRLTIDRLEQDNKRRYKVEDYQKLDRYYENKIQQIHIVGEYAKKLISDYKGALQFVDDYFQLDYNVFLNKYFNRGRQNEIKRNITPEKFRQLFGTLSPRQLEIINDPTKHIAALAGPGSGKTRVLVHKLASLLLMEDVKHEQLLMITFSRAGATEFKKRLLSLIGNAANYIEIKTFHSYCFDLLGKVGDLERSDFILNATVHKIKNGEIEVSRITKTVLVIDEAQDMSNEEYALINALIEQNEEMRVIAVGDDDQNIYEFRGASSRYLRSFVVEREAARHELLENYRSKNNLVEFANCFVKKIADRLKENPIVAHQTDNGKIKLVKHLNGNLVAPLVEDIISTNLEGTTCVLTKTNEEALQITGALLKNGMQAKLIQTNDGFSLRDLLEVRYLLDKIKISDNVKMISDDVWANAKNELRKKFQRSSKLEICNDLIKQFEESNNKNRYISDLEILVRESKLEDLYNENRETIYVSTIHKAKGKEFDNVFIMLENFSTDNDETKRQLYVAFTRAKRNLSIHLNGNYLDDLHAEDLERFINSEEHSPPRELVMHLSHKDIWLDYFITRQHLVSQFTSGDNLTIRGNECTTAKGESVLRFSKKFSETIEMQKQKGYHLKYAKVNFIVYWLKDGSDIESKIILPELVFEKQ